MVIYLITIDESTIVTCNRRIAITLAKKYGVKARNVSNTITIIDKFEYDPGTNWIFNNASRGLMR